MEPPEEARQWLRQLLGMAPEESSPSRPLEAWAILGPALAAVHAEIIPAETEPATQMLFPELEGPRSGGSPR